jgi:prolyl-tRNA editing enzyme YbaK/EbsC (Cys-tRNA(Pro) deacylase)
MGSIELVPALEFPDLVAPATLNAIRQLSIRSPNDVILVGKIDPSFAAGSEFCSQYGINPEAGANCLLVEGSRGENQRPAACLARVGYRVDINGVVRRTLNARRVTMLEANELVAELGMEKGSITVIGLPDHWPILIDRPLIEHEYVFMGSGLLRSKIAVPGRLLAELAEAVLLEDLVRSS